MHLRTAITAQNSLGEGPVWSIEENSLYWVDIQEKKLQRWSPKSNGYEMWHMPSEIGSFALSESGICVIALRNGFVLFDLDKKSVNMICEIESDMPFTRFNDGKCDRHGRFWAGTMDEEIPNRRASLYCLDNDKTCMKVRGNVGISNGLGWSPDNQVFYYTDSSTYSIFAYDFNAENGQISNGRMFIETPKNYVPDGLTVDADGFVWSAMWDGWKIVRFAPNGRIDLEIPLPVQRPTSCTFGGEDLSQLFITSARIGLSEKELSKQPEAGNVFVVDTKFRGLPEPNYMDG
jgi:sugar lactone lactonase YvrE